MVDNTIALRAQAPDVMNSFAQGQATQLQVMEAKRAQAEKSLQLIGAASMHALGGKLDGTPDPARYEEGLDMLQDMGIDVSKFRGKPQMANVAARASMTAMQQLQMAQDERQFEFAMEKFGRDMMEGDRAYGLAREKFDYQKGKDAEEANKPAPPSSSLGKLKADFDAGLIDEQTYKAAIDKATAQSGGITVAPDGTVTIGGQLGKLTEGQSKDVNYYIRGKAALDTVAQYEGALSSLKDSTLSGLPGGNYVVSSDFQQGQQAGREFLAAILRKDTGAAITNQEFEIYGPMFLPQPGDGPEVLEQKRTARARAIEAIRVGLGAKGDALGNLPESAPSGPPAAAARKTLNGKTYEQDENGDWYEVE